MAGAEVVVPRASGRWSDLLPRVLVGIALIALALAATYQGGVAFAVFAGVVGMLVLREWIDLQELGSSWLVWGAAVLLPTVSVASHVFIKPHGRWSDRLTFLCVPLLLQILSLGPGTWQYGYGEVNRHSSLGRFYYAPFWTDCNKITAGVLLAAVPAIALVSLREHGNGLLWVLWTFAIVWSADISAYLVGRLVGGPKLWSQISPGKTWAGFLGACLSATAASLAVAPYVGLVPVGAAIAGLLLGALAQGGDLFESWLKRRAGVKDSGNLLPGHGGVLDRLDSLVPVAPAVAAAVWLGWL